MDDPFIKVDIGRLKKADQCIEKDNLDRVAGDLLLGEE